MLKHRMASGITIGAAFLLALTLLPPMGAWIAIMAVAAVAQWEFYGMIRNAGLPVFRVIGLLCGAALITATFHSAGTGESGTAFDMEHAILLGSVIAIFVRQFPQKNNSKPVETIACTLLGLLYVPYLFNFLTRLAFTWDRNPLSGDVCLTGKLLILYLVVVVKFTDIGAYFTGRLFGRRKLFPRISPAKTWEGLLGGIAFALAASIVIRQATGGHIGVIAFGMRDAVILGIVLPLAGVVGDLFESLLKRACGIKDSASYVPGMGGLLDVLDSLFFGAPILYLYIRLFLWP